MRTVALMLLLLLVGGVAASRPLTFSEMKATTHIILTRSQSDPHNGALCSATAVAPDTIRTARHCVDGMVLVQVDNTPVEPYGTRMLPGDAAEVVLTKELFLRWATLGPPPRQGDRVRWWGNPGNNRIVMRDMYREGVVASAGKAKVAIDAMVCHGDSGAGLFNDAGELVGVVIEKMPDNGPCSFAIGQL